MSLMQESDVLRSPIVQPTQLVEVPGFLSLLLCSRSEICQWTTLPGTTVAARYSGNAIVDVESDELARRRLSICLARQ